MDEDKKVQKSNNAAICDPSAFKVIKGCPLFKVCSSYQPTPCVDINLDDVYCYVVTTGSGDATLSRFKLQQLVSAAPSPSGFIFRPSESIIILITLHDAVISSWYLICHHHFKYSHQPWHPYMCMKVETSTFHFIAELYSGSQAISCLI